TVAIRRKASSSLANSVIRRYVRRYSSVSWTVFSDSPDASTTCAQATRSFGIASAGAGFAVRRLQRKGITSPPLYHIVPAHAGQACSLRPGKRGHGGHGQGHGATRTGKE